MRYHKQPPLARRSGDHPIAETASTLGRVHGQASGRAAPDIEPICAKYLRAAGP